MSKTSTYYRDNHFLKQPSLYSFFTDLCSTNPCQNGGSCYSDQGGYVCECKSGFSGQNCQIGNVKLHCFNLRTYKQSYTPTLVREGRDGAPPLGFCCALIFRKELAFDRKPLMCSR